VSGRHKVAPTTTPPAVSDLFPDPLGKERKCPGTLFPDKYEFSTAFPGREWICPIRDCRNAFRSLENLGAHFSVGPALLWFALAPTNTQQIRHHSSTYNDNMDGTLSFRGHYHGSRPKPPAIVVSRGPTTDPPPVPPCLPQNAVMGDGTKTTTPRPVAELLHKPSELSEDWKTLWDYIRPHLTCHKDPNLPDKGWVRELITLPRVRDIQFNPKRQHTHPYRDTKDRDISALIIQVTGEPAPEPCTRCREGGKGPFVGCIMVAREAHPFPLRTVISCANCFYHYNQTYCSHKLWGARRADEIVQKRIAAGDPIAFLAERGTKPQQLQQLLNDTRSPSAVVDGTYQGSAGFPTLDPGAAATPSDISADSMTPTVAMEKGYVAIETTPTGRRYDMWFGKQTPLIPWGLITSLTSRSQTREQVADSRLLEAPFSRMATS